MTCSFFSFKDYFQYPKAKFSPFFHTVFKCLQNYSKLSHHFNLQGCRTSARLPSCKHTSRNQFPTLLPHPGGRYSPVATKLKPSSVRSCTKDTASLASCRQGTLAREVVDARGELATQCCRHARSEPIIQFAEKYSLPYGNPLPHSLEAYGAGQSKLFQAILRHEVGVVRQGTAQHGDETIPIRATPTSS